MFVQMLSFGTLVGIGLVYRRRREIHRPMMLLVTIAIQSGALGRFPYIETLAAFPPLYVWGPVLLFGGSIFALQWGMSRTPNRWYLMGYAGWSVLSSHERLSSRPHSIAASAAEETLLQTLFSRCVRLAEQLLEFLIVPVYVVEEIRLPVFLRDCGTVNN